MGDAMLLKKFGLTALILLCAFAPAHAAWRDLSVLNGEITLSAPADFGPMPVHLRPMPYPGIERPLVMLSDPDGVAMLTVNHTRAAVGDDIKVIRKTMSAVFHQSYRQASWLRDEVATVNGRPLAVFEFVAPENGTPMHNILYAARLRGTLLLIAFKAPEQGAPLWIEKGRAIMASVRLR